MSSDTRPVVFCTATNRIIDIVRCGEIIARMRQWDSDIRTAVLGLVARITGKDWR